MATARPSHEYIEKAFVRLLFLDLDFNTSSPPFLAAPTNPGPLALLRNSAMHMVFVSLSLVLSPRPPKCTSRPS